MTLNDRYRKGFGIDINTLIPFIGAGQTHMVGTRVTGDSQYPLLQVATEGFVFGQSLSTAFDSIPRPPVVADGPVFSGCPSLSGHVLVLNQDYRALTVTSVQRATVLVLLRKADLVESSDDRYIRSSRMRLPWPSIVRLRVYVRVPYKKIMLTRKNVMRRDGNTCQYCGARDRLTIDHVYPKSRGGRDTWENLVAACVPCNNRKGNKTPDEADMKLFRKPFRPSYVMYIRDFVGSVDDSWKPYLFLS